MKRIYFAIQRRICTLVTILINGLDDLRFQIKHTLSNPFMKTESMKVALIMLNMHRLEKGLSFKQKKNNWGKEKAHCLCKDILKLNKETLSDIRVQTALAILAQYKKDLFSAKEPSLISLIDEVLKFKTVSTSLGGSKEIKIPEFNCSEETIWHFYESRMSVRYYSQEPISLEDFEYAKKFAALTPSACNRQTSKVYSFSDRKIIRDILSTQLANQEWCNHAATIYVVVSNGSYFNGTYESKQAYVDGGMYAMNFCMGLHLKKIATCFKMFVRTHTCEKQFRKVTKIKDYEIPIVLIVAGHYRHDNEHYFTPLSHRIEE